MDPNATLAMLKRAESELRRLRATPDAYERTAEIETFADECVELRADLDQWIARGGFRPAGY